MSKYIEWREVKATIEFASYGKFVSLVVNAAIDFNEGLDPAIEEAVSHAAGLVEAEADDWTKINLSIARGLRLSYEDLSRLWAEVAGDPETLEHIKWSDDSAAQEEGH